jgi:hypothetical protein
MHLLRRAPILAVLLAAACSTAPHRRALPPGQLRRAEVAHKKACFVAGTPVTLPDGTTRPIEKLQVGDRILSYDAAEGATAEGIVSATLVHPDTSALLRINDELTTTPEHLFYVQGSWVAAGDLREGDLLQGIEIAGGKPVSRPVPVTALEPRPGDGVTTYNLEVTPHHVYFAGGLLVHNAKKR